MLLVGDSGGMVNPFNGEGIAYAMESGELAAEVAVQALARPAGAGAGAGAAGVPARAEGPLRRLLPARRDLREADRPSGDHADRHQARHAAPDADALRAQAAGQPDRPARRGRDGPGHQRDDEGGASRLDDGIGAGHGPGADEDRPPPTASARDVNSVIFVNAPRAGKDEQEKTMSLSPYAPIIGLFALAAAFSLFSVGAARFAGPRRYNKAKLEAYECGIEPSPQPVGGGRFPIKFYLTAMLFIVFDIEIIFLYPWAVSFDALPIFGFVEMVLFIVAVFVAYAYVWRRGGLDWD